MNLYYHKLFYINSLLSFSSWTQGNFNNVLRNIARFNISMSVKIKINV